MKVILIVTITFILSPFLSLFIYKKVSNKHWRSRHLPLVIFILLLVFILAMIMDISFIDDIPNLIYISLTYLGLCYLVWYMIFLKTNWLKVLGIFLSIIVFAGGLFIIIGSTSILKNEDTEPCIENTYNNYELIVYCMFLESKEINVSTKRIFQVTLYKKIGPVKKIYLYKFYDDPFPYPDKNKEIEFSFDEIMKEVHLTIREHDIIIWKDIIK